jgi:hypothetical protein
MTARLLDPLEWPRLEGTELGEVWPLLPPGSLVIAVEDQGGAIVGCWALLQCWHVEGLWVAPPHRGRSAVIRHLWRGVKAIGAALGVREVLTGALTPEIERLLAHVGARAVPGGTFVVPLTQPRGRAVQERVM